MGVAFQGGRAEVGSGDLKPATAEPPPGRTVRVLVDVLAIDKELDYLLPHALGDVVVGTIVRVPLAGRRVRGWVTAVDSEPPEGVTLKPIRAVVGAGPDPELMDVARWAAWRWAGPRARFLRTASPPVVVKRAAVPASTPTTTPVTEGSGPGFYSRVLRIPPAADGFGAVLPFVKDRMASGGSVVMLVPAGEQVDQVANLIARAGLRVATMPRGWAAAARGGRVVVGARAAAWAPAPDLAGVVVLDAHDESYREERAPAWNAVRVAEERARRAQVPFLAVSPCPPVELLHERELVTVSRSEERDGWAPLEVVDMSREDPHSGLFSAALVKVLANGTPHEGRQVLCVLNRRGRATLIACGACRQLIRCETCGAAMDEGAGVLECRVCKASRPVVCAGCGATRLRRLRPGVTRVAEELAALTGASVAEVTGGNLAPGGETFRFPGNAVVVGTEAVLNRVRSAAAVVFLDFDREMLAPRLGAPQHGLSLLARASRVTGGRSRGGRVLVQTRCPDDAVVCSALHSDPSILARDESAHRSELGLPPYGALALVSGEGSAEVVKQIATRVEVAEVAAGKWMVRAGGHDQLCDAIAVAIASAGLHRPRVEVDPVVY